jgi:hypothetical protein
MGSNSCPRPANVQVAGGKAAPLPQAMRRPSARRKIPTRLVRILGRDTRMPTGKAAHHRPKLTLLRRTKRAVATIRAKANTITSIKDYMASLQKGLTRNRGSRALFSEHALPRPVTEVCGTYRLSPARDLASTDRRLVVRAPAAGRQFALPLGQSTLAQHVPRQLQQSASSRHQTLPYP